jgi:DNA-binding PadR family transcriptional regulator
VLGLLKEHQLHGYELKKRSRELLGPLARVSFGSLYPALARLERDGAVAAVDEQPAPAASPIPSTGSLGGEVAAFQAARRRVGRTGHPRRGRKVYGITPVGERRLATLLEVADEDDRTFTLQLAFARHLPAPARRVLLEARRRQLEARLVEAQHGLEAGSSRLDTYLRSVREHAVESTRHDLAWIDRLIEAEQTTGRPDAPPPTPSTTGAVATGAVPTGSEHTGGPHR